MDQQHGLGADRLGDALQEGPGGLRDRKLRMTGVFRVLQPGCVPSCLAVTDRAAVPTNPALARLHLAAGELC